MRLTPAQGAMVVPGLPPGAQFEVRWGAAATSSKMHQPPQSKIIQVNVANDNTRIVKCTSSTATGAIGGTATQTASTLAATAASSAAAAAAASTQEALSFDRDHWSSADHAGMDAQKLFTVDSRSVEHAKVAESFLKTLPHKTIDRIERIENGLLQESFVLSASNLQKMLKASTPQPGSARSPAPTGILLELFHGTSAVDLIVNSADGHGFLPLLAGTAVGAIWGDGTYFARDAKYSDSYACQLPSGQKQMLVVDVLVGRYAQGAKGMKMCPLVPGEKYIRFNSLVNNMRQPSIYVVQHSDQAYPKYLITYH